MEYLNIPISLFTSPEFIGSDPTQRATWIALLGWTFAHESGGIVPDCKKWSDRRWAQTCGVTYDEVRLDCDLYHFDGNDLIVFGYPADFIESINAQKKASQINGKKGGRPRKNGNTKITQPKPRGFENDNPDETQGFEKPKPSNNLNRNPAITVSKEVSNISPPYVGDIQGSSSSLRARAGIEALPTSVDEVVKVISASRGVHPIGDELILCATKFFETMEIQGWVTRDNVPIAKWSIAAQRWATKWVLGDRGEQYASSAGQPPDKDYSFDLPSSVNPQANTGKP